VSGTLGGTFDRKRSGRSDWTEAKVVAAEWEHAKRWDDAQTRPLQPAPPTLTNDRKPIADAIQSYLPEYKDAAVSTKKNYRLLLECLQPPTIPPISIGTTFGFWVISANSFGVR
jgi:hypothetical protein